MQTFAVSCCRNLKARASSLLLAGLVVGGSLCGSPAQAQAPPVIVTSPSAPLAHSSSSFGSTDTTGTLGRVGANSRGDVFYLNTQFNNTKNFLVEVPAGTTTPVLLMSNISAFSYGVYVDPQGNLWVADANAKPEFIPFVNGSYATGVDASTLSATQCTYPVSTNTKPCLYKISTSTVGYYAQAQDFAVDGGGNVYIVDRNDGTTGGAHKRIVKYSPTGTTTILVDNLAPTTTYSQIAVTSAGDIYYVDGTGSSVSLYPAGSATPTIIGTGFTKPSGLSLDASGSLYVTDVGSNRILVIPNVGGAVVTGNQFQLANVTAVYGVGIDGAGNVYYGANGSGQNLTRLSVGNLNLGSGTFATPTAAQTINLSFSAPATFGSVTVLGGPAAAPFVVGANTCTAGRFYAIGSTCSVTLTYTASAAGSQAGALLAYDATGGLLAQATLTGYGLAPLLNLDPGVVTPIGSSLKNPSAIAVDGAGNTYVADSGAGSIYKNGASTPIATGLVAPSAIAVDGAGNLYVASTGIVQQIPYAGASYGTATTLYTGLSGPSGLALDSAGRLYVADSGHARVLLLTSSAGQGLGSMVTTIASGLASPVAVAVDNLGNLFVSDSGSNQVYRIALGTRTQATLLTGLTAAAGIAADASGGVFSADSGKQTITHIPVVNGSLSTSQATTVGTIVATPAGLAVDSLGNIYATDATAGTVATMLRSSGTLNFGPVIVPTASPALAATLSSEGTAPVVLATPYYTGSGATTAFALQSSSTCADGATIAVGGTCTVAATFSPSANGVQAETLTFASNAAAAALTLQGTGVPKPLATISGPASVVYGATATYSVASAVDGKFTVNIAGPTTTSVPVTVSAGAGSFTLPPLSVGSYTFSLPVNGTTGFLIVAVSKAALTVTANDATRAYGVANPAFTATVSGAANQDTFTTGGTTTATLSSAAGKYFIVPTVSGPALGNYTVSAVNGSLTITKSASTVVLSPSVSSVPAAGSVALTAAVASVSTGTPTGNVQFYNGTSLLGTVALSNGAATYGYIAPPNGLLSLSAVYVGDANFSTSTSTALGIPVGPASYNLAVAPASLTLKQGGSGTATITVTPYAGFNQAVVFSCAGLPAGASCSFNPASVTPNGSAVTAQLTIVTSGATAMSRPEVPWKGMEGTTTLALLLGAFTGWRRKRLVKGLLVFCCAAILGASSLVGCGSSTSATIAPTPVGTVKATVTASSAAVATQKTGSLTLVVTN